MKKSSSVVFVLLAVAGCAGGSGQVGPSPGDDRPETSDPAPIEGCGSPVTVEASRVCVPGTAKANASITVDIEAAGMGCFECGKQVRCTVAVAGDRITLALQTIACTVPPGYACAAVCRRSTTCELPALSAGTYRIDVTSPSVAGGMDPRTLVVGPDPGGATSCSLSSDSSINPSTYGTSCVLDDDCTLVNAGDLCELCACPDASIAKSSLPEYETDARAKSSQCTTSKARVGCQPCPPKAPKCNLGTCGIDG
jgi:hypothetical protein